MTLSNKVYADSFSSSPSPPAPSQSLLSLSQPSTMSSSTSASAAASNSAQPLHASAPSAKTADKYQPEPSTPAGRLAPSHRPATARSRVANLCRPWWLFQRYIARPIQRQYLKLPWTTRTTVGVAISLFAVLYTLLSVPFRIGFLYNPFGSFSENVKWTYELETFFSIDLVVDAIGVVEFADFYRVWKDAFSQLSQSVSFELGKKMSRELRSKSPKITQRVRKTSSVMRSTKAKWTLTTITPSVSSVDAASKNYREKKIQFVLELIAVLPLEVIPLALGQPNALHLVRFTKLCRVYRLQQCLDRIGKIYSESQWVQRLSYTGISGLVRRIGIGAMLAHWFACGYMLVAHTQCGVFFEFCSLAKQTSWVIRDQLPGSSILRQYGRAIYWASRTMVLLGYDDVTPVSDAETLYAIVVQVVGALLSTSILATFQFIFRYRNSRQAAFAAHVDNAREYMKSQNIPRTVRRKVMDYFTYAWTTHHGLDSEDALRLMPKHLQSKVIYTLKATRIKQVCFLMKESVEFVNHLALALLHRVYAPDDSIIEPKFNAKMFFVIRGTVVLSAFDGSGAKECQTGDFFADCCLLAPETYEEKAVAKTFCELYVLEKAKLDAALAHFYRGHESETHDRMREVFEKYSTQLRKTKKLLGLRGGGGSTDSSGNGAHGTGSTSGSAFARLGMAWRLPSSTFRVRWDFLRFLAIIFVAFEVPYYIVFISNHDAQRNFLVEQEIGLRYAAALTVELFFMLDMVLRAQCFAYLDPTVMLNVVDSDMIFAAYKANGFYLDLVAVLPLSLVLETIQGSAEDYSWIFRLGRLLRLRYITELVQDLGDYYGLSSKFQLVATLLLGVTLTLHMVGCIWFVMAWMPMSWDDTSTLHDAVIDATALTRQSCLYMATNFHNCSWVKFDCYGHIGATFPIHNADSFYKGSFAYLRSLYWSVVALTAVGYGDIVAFSTAESYFAALWIFIGGIINFGVVGAMSSTISNLMASQHHHVEKLNTLNNIMEHLHISETLRSEIRRFYHSQFRNRKRAYESQLLQHLPDQLCYQISTLLHSDSIKCIALFDAASREFLMAVTGKFRHRSYQHGETIVLEGDVCKEFIVILHGKVNVFFQSKRVPIGALHDGDCYGVHEFLLKRAHSTTLSAVSHVHASVMAREQFDAIVLKFASDIADLKDEAQQLWLEDMARLRRIARNLEALKLQPHVLATTTMFYQKDSASGHTIGVASSGHHHHHANASAYRDPDALRASLQSAWHIVLTLCNLYNAFGIIFRIAFHSHMHLSHALFTAMWVTDIACDVCFAADMYLRLYYFGCEDVGLANLWHRKDVDARYRKSRRLKRDLVTSLPLYVIDSHQPFASAMCRLPRLIRCLDLWAYLDDVIVQIQQAFASQNVSSYLSPVKLLLLLLLIAHYAASIFFLISDYECHQSAFCWLETDHLLHIYHHSIGALYIRSFYWALTTLTLVGSREIVPRGTLGTVWATVTCLCCTFVMGHIVGELSDLIIDVNKEEREHKSRIESFENFAKEHALPDVLRERVALFFKVQFEKTHGHDLDATMHDLSANLKLKLMHEMYGATIATLPISRFLTYSQVNNFALRLRSDMFIPGDAIVAEDTFGSRLCIMRHGLAGVFWTASVTTVAVLVEGAVFGEVAFFLPQQRRIASVKAITSCEVLYITKHDWHDLWLTNGDASETQVQKYALNAILDWVKDRVAQYQTSCLRVAAKTKHYILTRTISANLRGMMATPTGKPVLIGGVPKLKRARTFVTPEAVVLEKKAKYVLAKAEVFAAKHRQYLASLAHADGHSARSGRTSFRFNKSTREGDTSRRHLPLPALSVTALPHAFTAKKKAMAPPKSLDFAHQQFFVQVNPVNKHVREHMDDHHLALLEVECWQRYKYLASVKHTVSEMMNRLMPSDIVTSVIRHEPRAKPAPVAPPCTPPATPSRRSSVLTRRHSRRQNTPIETMKVAQQRKPLMRVHSIHSDALRAVRLTPRLDALDIHQYSADASSHQRRALLARPLQIAPLPASSNEGKVETSGSVRALRFAQVVDASSRSLLHDIRERSGVAARTRLARSQSLPSFDHVYFDHVKRREEHMRSVTRRAASSIESTLSGSTGLDFEILQRCQRPKFSTLFHMYRRYHHWKQHSASSSSSSGGSQASQAGSFGASGKLSLEPGANARVIPKPKVRASFLASAFSSRRRSSVNWQRVMHQANASNQGSTANSEEFLTLVKKMSKAWDLAMLLVALYFSVSVPFKVCFVTDLSELSPTALRAWSGIEYLLDALCFINLAHKVQQSNYFTRMLLLRGRSRSERISLTLALARSVVLDAEFRYDILALVPLDFVVLGLSTSSASHDHGDTYAAQWKHLCFLRLNKILHAMRIQALSESVIQYAVYDIKVPVAEAKIYFARSLCSYLMMGHYIACIWYATSEKAYHDYAYSWLSATGMLVSVIEHETPAASTLSASSSSTTSSSSGHTGAVDLTHVSLTRKYFRSMHFAIGSITTLFYGDIVSMNLLELFVEIAVILWSIYIYGTLVGAHGEMQQFHSKRKAIFEQNLSELQHYLVLNQVPKGLKKQVKQYYASIWRRRRGEEELSAIAGISRTLQEDIVYATLHRFAWKVSIFHSLDVHFLRALLVRLTFVICSESEEVVIRGDVDRSMYFISHGRVLVKQDKFEVTKEKGEFFGELALLYGVPRHETCISLTISELYRLDHEPYEELLRHFPEYRTENRLDWTTNDAAPTPLSAILQTLVKRASSAAVKTTPAAAAAAAVGTAAMPSKRTLKDIVEKVTSAGASTDRRGSLQQRQPHSFNANGIAEEKVTSCYIYRATMELMSHLDKVDSLEAKDIITKARHGAREYMKRVAGVVTARHRNANDDDSGSPREYENEVRDFDSTNFPGAGAASDDDDDGSDDAGPSRANLGSARASNDARRMLFKRNVSAMN